MTWPAPKRTGASALTVGARAWRSRTRGSRSRPFPGASPRRTGSRPPDKAVLVDEGRWICDSWTIANHLEDSYPDRPSLFGGPSGRALSRFYNAWADSFLLPGLLRFAALDIWHHVHEKDKDYFRRSREERFGTTLEKFVADRAQRVEGFRQSLTPLRLTLQAQPFLGGDTPLYPDYIVLGCFQWVRCISDFKVLAADDPVALWCGRMLGLFDGLAGAAKGYPA
jgi:glutathione S-transferase